MGPVQSVISVCGFDAVQQVLNNEDLDNRPHCNMTLTDEAGNKQGVLYSDGPLWEEQRQFTSKLLHNLAFSSENLIQEEINEFIKELNSSSTSDGVVNLKGVFTTSVINILWGIIGGQKLKRDDPTFKQLSQTVEVIFQTSQSPGIMVHLHRLIFRYLPILKSFFGYKQELLQPMMKLIEELIEREESELSSSQETFIQLYIKETEKQKSNPTSIFTRHQLIATIIDLFAAGAETSSNTIGFALLHLLHNIDVQKKLQEELDAVCGDNLPILANRPNLPYTEAFLMEAQRISSVAPLGVPHYNIKKTQLGEYTVPKGSIILLNYFDIHNDESYWGDPHVFRPERHFDRDGTLLRSDHFLPFGQGKRQCIGKSLAENVYYLFIATLAKVFNLENVKDQPLPTLNPIEGPTLRYENFQAVFTARNQISEITHL